ncbi:MAG: hypothetical protein ACR2OZ_01770 [Verrucomicrobiales bacterium]
MIRVIYIAAALVMSSVLQAAEPARPTKIDFEQFKVGPLPDDFMVVEGEFRIAEQDGKKVLELLPQPIADGAVLVGPSASGASSIRALTKAEKSRRSFPRFGLGLQGISGTKLRVVPAQKTIELVQGEAQIAKADFEWKENTWLVVELNVGESAGAWTAEARVWLAGGRRPDQPSLTAKLPGPPGQGRPSVIGTPYANKPIYFDDVEVGI